MIEWLLCGPKQSLAVGVSCSVAVIHPLASLSSFFADTISVSAKKDTNGRSIPPSLTRARSNDSLSAVKLRRPVNTGRCSYKNLSITDT